MPAADPHRVKDLFLAAADLPPADRPAFLAGRCAGDDDLRRRVEGLLAAHDQSAGPLGPPPAADGTVTLDPNGTADHPAGRLPVAGKGTVVAGRYKLIEPIGDGGMGTVWMAEQREPVKRLVAVKLIKPGMDSEQVLARFEAERQALALMDHPNIAKVLDGGTTDDGHPFFVMELVKGVPITKFCDDYRLTPQQRLELFVPVCQAVQHAHTKGVIHRDLKPSNVLVALYDERPVPKVIDFGVAKATGQALTERTLHTTFGTVVGTPEYMSPEQATFNQLDVDTRTDVYALGVLLYELLAGSPPFRRNELEKVGLLEMLRVVREQDPPRPSTRLSTSAALPSIAASRHTEPRKLTALVRGELDWIVMKALEKDRSRRYETASGLAGDVRRFLDGEPVLAVPPSAGYRLRKLVGKNRGPVAAATVVLLALVGGVVGTTWQAVRATGAERAAVASAAAATTAREEADANAKAAVAAKEEADRLAEQRRLNLYANRIGLAWHAWEEGDLPRMRELLDTLVPAAGQADLRGFEWHYLNRLARHRDQTFQHPHPVRGLAVSPDGKTLATVSPMAKEVWLWDVPSGAVRRKLPAEGGTWAVAFAPNGQEVAAACDDGTVRTWDPATGEARKVLTAPGKPVGSLAYSPDGSKLAAGVGAWTHKGGNPVNRFLPNGWDRGPNPIVVWDTDTWKEAARLDGHPKYVLCLAFRPNGKELASGGADGALKVWDLEAGKERHSTQADNTAVFAVAYSADGKQLAAGGWDMTIRLLHPDTGRGVGRLTGATGPVFGLAFNPDGAVLLSAGFDRLVRGWLVGAGREGGRALGHTGPLTGLAFSPDGKTQYTAGWDGDVHAWPGDSPQNCSYLFRAPGRGPMPSYHTAFSPDSRLLAATSAGEVVLYDVPSRQEVRHLTLGPGENDLSVAFRPDGKQFAAAGINKLVHRWETAGWTELAPMKAHDSKVWGLAYSPDGRLLATASGMYNEPGELRLYDPNTGELVFRHKPDPALPRSKSVRSVAFGAGGRTLLFGLGDRIGRLDVSTRTELPPRPGFDFVYASADGRLEAMASRGPESAFGSAHEIGLWDVAADRVKARLRGHTADVYQTAFAPDGKTVATASWDGTVKLWHTATGAELMTIRRPAGVIWTVAFSPDNRYLAIGAGTRGIRELTLWDARPPGER